MTATFSRFGNDLHAGRRTVPLVTRRRTWYTASLLLVVLLAVLSGLRGPNLGIEFTGGSEFQVAGVSDTEQTSARDVVRHHLPDNEPKITVLGSNTLRVQTEQLDSEETAAVATDLAAAYDVPAESVSTSYIGPVWSGDVTQKMLRGVVVFLLLVTLTMALYFRNLKSSLAAMAALVHDMLVTAGIYLVVGFEITPGTVIGFLTVMGYSLYDTIVVFDKVRENTAGIEKQTRSTFADEVELAANQTLIRSINTSVVALLPVGSILAIGAFLLGAGTLKDISLALFIGIIAGTYSSIFLAPGFLVDLRRREPALRAQAARVEAVRSGRAVEAGEDETSRASARASDDMDSASDADADAEGYSDGASVEDAPAGSDDPVGAADRPATGRRARTQPRRTTRRRRRGATRGER